LESFTLGITLGFYVDIARPSVGLDYYEDVRLSAIARCGGRAVRQETVNGEGRHDRSSEGDRSCDALHELPPVERNTPQDLSLDAVFVHHSASFDEVPIR